jgi:hypothetical protein
MYYRSKSNKLNYNNMMLHISKYCCTITPIIECLDSVAGKTTVCLHSEFVIRGFQEPCADSSKKLKSLKQVVLNNLYPSQINGATTDCLSLKQVDLGWGYGVSI